MKKHSRRKGLTLALSLGIAMSLSGGALAQSSASSYSYGTYNPVQAAINRNSMNAAIIRQATGGKRKLAAKPAAKVKPRRHR